MKGGDVASDINGALVNDHSRSLEGLKFELGDHEESRRYELKDVVSDLTGRSLERFSQQPVELSDGAFDEIGSPGTQVTSGILSYEPTTKYRPYQVRGHVTRHGLYEKLYRQDTVLFSGINEGNNIFLSGDIKFVCPDVPKSQKSAAQKYTEWTNRWWRRQWRGRKHHMKHMGAAKIFGFYVFEPVWGVDEKGRVGPVKLAPREPSTVDRWIFSHRGDELVAASFRLPSPSSGGEMDRGKKLDKTDLQYTLTARGTSLTRHKLLVANILNRSNNVEGISLVRPTIPWIKFKQVLHQIAAVTAQKYGVPMAVIMQDPAALENIALTGDSADQNDGAFIFKKVSGQQANQAPVYQLDAGWKIDLLAPPGTMPTMEGLFELCDQNISKPTHSESGLLGGTNAGSYALSEVLDNKHVRAQPGFASDVTESLNWMVRDIAIWHDLHLDEYPYAVWEMDGYADNSRWIKDATQAMGGRPMDQWPQAMQKEATKKLSLPPTTFDNYEPPAMDRPQGVSVQGAEFSDAKCCGPKEQPVELSDLGTILAKHHGTTHKTITLEDEEPQDTLTAADGAGLAAGASAVLLDRAERRMGLKLRKVAQEHRRTFRKYVRDGDMSARAADTALRQAFLPQYEDVIREGIGEVSVDSKKQLLRDLGFSVARDAEMPSAGTLNDALDEVAYDIAASVYGRQEGLMRRSMVEDAQAEGETGVPILATSTLSSVSRSAATRAHNAGRDDLVRVIDEAKPDLPPIMAKRTSMLDGATCDVCYDLDFEKGDHPAIHVAGSGAYYRNMPPRHCKSATSGNGTRCRCAYIYEIPVAYEGTLEEIARNQGFKLPG